MTALSGLLQALAGGEVDVIDLTQPLSEATPIIQLPPPLANTPGWKMHEISHYDDAGPAWYWNWFEGGEHVGTHLDAPIHWITGQDSDDVSEIPVRNLIGPAAVLDATERVAADPDFLLSIGDVRAFESEQGPLPEGGWLLYRTGWDARAQDQAAFLNADDTGPHSPGIAIDCAKWLAEETPIVGLGVETVGTDAGKAHSFEPAFPCHTYMLGANKYGLTQLANLSQLPPTGSILVVAPLKIVRGSGSPARVLALVPR
ncbi:MAG TPA: cyclase family protein [Actinomycetota bacterium]